VREPLHAGIVDEINSLPIKTDWRLRDTMPTTPPIYNNGVSFGNVDRRRNLWC